MFSNCMFTPSPCQNVGYTSGIGMPLKYKGQRGSPVSTWQHKTTRKIFTEKFCFSTTCQLVHFFYQWKAYNSLNSSAQKNDISQPKSNLSTRRISWLAIITSPPLFQCVCIFQNMYILLEKFKTWAEDAYNCKGTRIIQQNHLIKIERKA